MTSCGCGSGGGQKDAKRSDPNDGLNSPPKQLAQTSKLEIVSRNEKRQRNWKVVAKSSELSYGADSKLGGSLKGLTGELFQDDVLVSKLRADEGIAEQENERLELTGNVEITEVKQGTRLTANKVSRLRTGIIEASGNVWVKGRDGSIGPAEKIWATPDLMQIGTPDRFKMPKKSSPSLSIEKLKL